MGHPTHVPRHIARVHARMERAKFDYHDYVEITREEYDYFRTLLTHDNEPAPDGWPTWAKEYRFVPPPGTQGVIFGFPVKVVDTLSRPDPNSTQ